MAVSVEKLLKERKYPFILSFCALLLIATFFFLNYTRSSVDFTPDLVRSQLNPESNTSSNLTTGTPSTTATPPPTVSVLTKPSAEAKPGKNGVSANDDGTVESVDKDTVASIDWKVCRGSVENDYIPCLDNARAVKGLKSIRHKEHRERHCPVPHAPRCLVPLTQHYKAPVLWPKSRDMVWFDNVPHPKLVEYKKDQNWVRMSGNYLVFPGGGTQFKDGVAHYIQFIEKTLPAIKWGEHTRIVLDVGCGVASFGGYLLDNGVMTMSFAPKDEHEAQIQLALERGIPAIISVIGTQRLTFADNTYDLIHCARCRVHWHGDGGKPLIELNRILRPGGYFVWSATPVYRHDEKHEDIWKTTLALAESMCWTVAARTIDSSGIGLVIFQKPVSSSCCEKRKENNPPLCSQDYKKNISWYTPLDGCLPPLPVASWPEPWPKRLRSRPLSLPKEADAGEYFDEDTNHWSYLVSEVYLEGVKINWSTVRNVMDMNAGYGGFAVALMDFPLWVMNVVPVSELDTLPVIFDRGLLGIYHDWCESFSTYPRSYDLLHSSFLFEKLSKRCEIIDVAIEVDRILRPGGTFLVLDRVEVLNNLGPILRSLHWSVDIYQDQFLIGKKGFWRPDGNMRI